MHVSLIKQRPAIQRSTEPLARFHQRIAEKARDRSARPILIVALGDSVTQGLAEVDRFLHDEVYHQQLKRKLEARYPLSTFSVVNAGADGQCASQGLERFTRDVAAHQPDLLLVAFGLNDATSGGAPSIGAFAEAIESMIQQTRRHTTADVILMTPNMMLARENNAVPERYHHLTQLCLRSQNTGILKRYAQRLREIGHSHGVPVADIYGIWESLAVEGVDTTAMLANGLNHPNGEGHRISADAIFEVIEEHAPGTLHRASGL